MTIKCRGPAWLVQTDTITLFEPERNPSPTTTPDGELLFGGEDDRNTPPLVIPLGYLDGNKVWKGADGNEWVYDKKKFRWVNVAGPAARGRMSR